MPVMIRQVEYLSAKEAAHYCGASYGQLRAMRNRQDGPPYTRIGWYIWYARPDLDHWLDQNSAPS